MTNESMEFNTPVLFLVFNRPSTTAEVFEAIRKAKPPRLYVAADGPRPDKNGEVEKVARVREIATDVDWPCEVKTLFRQENLGCKSAVSGAITWFFEQEAQGIILEDDCLPDFTFFQYCEELLNYYKYDTRIMHISGCNHGLDDDTNESTYRFSKLTSVWGWASWRRAWQYYDVDIKIWPTIRLSSFLEDVYSHPDELRVRMMNWNSVYSNYVDTWDYQWLLTCVSQSGLSLIPNKNTVRNIGFGGEATHTKDKTNRFSSLPVLSIEFPIRHPPFMMRDIRYDRLYFTQNSKGNGFSRLIKNSFRGCFKRVRSKSKSYLYG
jgi:hypothetical protein